MEKFPERIELPKEIPQARDQRYRALVRSSLKGILVRGFIASIELLVALAFSSAAIFMDALSTAVDIGSSAVLVLSFKIASRPPDTNHPFGHGRYEPLAGLQLGLFLAILGGGMFFYNTSEIPKTTSASLNPYLWLVPLFSFLMLEGCYQLIMRTARKENSPALAADALHYRIDSISGVIATLALLIASYIPQYSQIFDHIGAALISIFMIVIGLIAARNNVHQLLDRIPDKNYFERVKEAALRTPGVMGTEKIRMQLSGPDAHVDIDVEVEPNLTVEKAHKISQNVRVEIQKEIPLVRDVIVHIEPYYPNDHKDSL